MSSWAPAKYKTTNWAAYNDSLKRRGSLSIWFDPEMVWTPPPSGKRGRQQQFSDTAIQACLNLKVLFGMPLRQTTGFVESLLRLAGLDWAVQDFSTLCRRQKTPNVSLPDQNSGSVTADGAYDTRNCHDAIAARCAHAIIPPPKNAKLWKPTSAGAMARNKAVNASRYLGRALWRRWSGYHRRRRVETKMHCVKLLGQSLKARGFDRQVAEILVRVAVLNRYTALGIPVTEPVG